MTLDFTSLPSSISMMRSVGTSAESFPRVAWKLREPSFSGSMVPLSQVPGNRTLSPSQSSVRFQLGRGGSSQAFATTCRASIPTSDNSNSSSQSSPIESESLSCQSSSKPSSHDSYS